MVQYIDKSAVVAEIERRYETNLIGAHSAFKNGKIEALREVKDFLDTLEVKEVNSTDASIEKVESFLNKKDDRDYYTIGYIKRHLKEIIKEVGL